MQTAPPTTDPTTHHDQAHAWSERGLGKPWQIRFFERLIRTFGKRPAYHVSYCVVFWYVLTSRAIRARTRPYLSRRFPSHRNPFRRLLDVFLLIRNFARSLIDIAALSQRGPRSLTPNAVEHDGFADLCRTPSGVILLSAHFGCYLTGLSTLHGLSKPVRVVMIPSHDTAGLLYQTAQVIDPRNGLQSMLEITDALLGGQVVSLLGDRVFGDERNVVQVHFLGSPVNLPLAPYRLASLTGAPIGVMVIPKTGISACDIRLLGVIHVPPDLGRDPARYAPYARQFADALAKILEEYPWQFYNFYDLWRENASASAPRSPAP